MNTTRDQLRNLPSIDSLLAGESADTTPEAISAAAAAFLEKKFSPSLRRAINATGILMHSGLGRAVLFDFRTIAPGEDDELRRALLALFSHAG